MAGWGWAGARQVAAEIRCREVSAVEVLAEQLGRIGRYDAELGSVVTLDAPGGAPKGRGGGQGAGRGQRVGPAALGVTIEDIHATAGMRSTFGGYRPFANHVPAADATVVAV